MFELKPHLSERVWGGETLKRLKNISTNEFPTPLGETWEVSTHQDGISKVVMEDYSEVSLKQFLTKDLSYLVKFISCEDSLSVQVHPGDEYAKIHENSRGKTECWIILEAEPGAGLYLGFKPGFTRESFQKIIDEKEDASKALNFYAVKPGDFFYVPHGSVHALGKGITLVEIQQSSGVTYRVWDWNRVGLDGKPRELHVKKSFDVLNFSPEANTLQYFKHASDVLNQSNTKLVNHEDFKVETHCLKQGQTLELKDLKKTTSIIVLNGSFTVGNKVLKKYFSYLFSTSEAKISAQESGCFLVVKE